MSKFRQGGQGTCAVHFNRKYMFTAYCRLQSVPYTFWIHRYLHRYYKMTENEHMPITSFGLISDLQYADVEDGYNFSKTYRRYYRRSLDILNHVIAIWNGKNVQHMFQLGDFIDGKAKHGHKSEETLNTALNVCKSFNGEIYHVFGNHDLYNFLRSWLLTSSLCSANLKNCVSPGGDRAYYYIDLREKLRVIVLDSYDVSLIGIDEGSVEYQKLLKTFKTKNRNADLNDPTGLAGTNKRFTKYNGGLGVEQLAWLDKVCSESEDRKQNVIVMGHTPVNEDTCDVSCLCWNYDEVMSVLANHKACVVCYMAGHDHVGGYSVDSSGILHLTFPGVIEASDMDCYATAFVYKDCIEIQGVGDVPSHTVPLRFPCI